MNRLFSLLPIAMLTFFSVHAQWNSSGDNSTTGAVRVLNPNNPAAVNMLSWTNDIARIRIGGTGSGASNGFVFQGVGDFNLMRLLQNGNVGIGTSTPNAKLEVLGSAQNASIVLGEENFIGFKRAGGSLVYGIGHENGEFTIGRAENLGSTAGTQINIASGGYAIKFSQGTTERMRIADNGNVGIGTTNPSSYKLSVNGNIRAKEIKVETGWADYVFKEGYDLPTLEEVEKHIQEKGHLINIPSAQEVEENGIQLGEMNMKLLEKIEELTLYTLEQEEKLNAQNLKIEILENENKKVVQLEGRLQKLEKFLK
ncbi:MAG: hypothetical protein ABJN84_03515 [Flavobacteriaceae bacterium]